MKRQHPTKGTGVAGRWWGHTIMSVFYRVPFFLKKGDVCDNLNSGVKKKKKKVLQPIKILKVVFQSWKRKWAEMWWFSIWSFQAPSVSWCAIRSTGDACRPGWVCCYQRLGGQGGSSQGERTELHRPAKLSLPQLLTKEPNKLPNFKTSTQLVLFWSLSHVYPSLGHIWTLLSGSFPSLCCARFILYHHLLTGSGGHSDPWQ